MIDKWLEDFKQRWLSKDIDAVLNLFTDDVQYWETPFRKIKDKEVLRGEWQIVLSQSNIALDLEVFSSDLNKHTALWNLSYSNAESAQHEWSGIYLVVLNEEGRCTYFYQVGEETS